MVLLLRNEHSTQTRSHHDAHAVGIFPVELEPRVGHGFFGRHHRELGEAIDARREGPVDVVTYAEAVNLAGDLGAEGLHGHALEGAELRDPRAPGPRGFPELPDADAEGGHDAQPGHDGPRPQRRFLMASSRLPVWLRSYGLVSTHRPRATERKPCMKCVPERCPEKEHGRATDYGADGATALEGPAAAEKSARKRRWSVRSAAAQHQSG